MMWWYPLIFPLLRGASKRVPGSWFLGLGLELGGKDPAYVRADADLDHAIENLVDGAMFNSGQSCCGLQRIYVHESLADSFIERYAAAAGKHAAAWRKDTNLIRWLESL